ncbi:glycoside hydrolase family 2 TIM barrel-domain containing protein [Rariglobus hedericola]|uniref:Endo-1,3-beta-glucanase btgC n=1 Tax=Rariglobus hedericola TaxID=2597822 RepID=A0A556QS45_9BACT|nr:glycoside hydrolase family 2 TIM barrel-domain containing protein [Rariglobus hedericola]TSJ79460.1 hypothetical protein FPL22_09285 [Rariglobus hedericola]
MKTPRLLLALVFTFAASMLPAAPSKVAIVSKGAGYELQFNGQPYIAKGVTFSGSGGPANYEKDMARLASIGVNSIRTWGVGDDTLRLLDAAHKNGITVMVGLWLRHGRPGMEGDDSFDYTKDTSGVRKQLDDTIAAVRKYKDHPAVLVWGAGNEVILNCPNDAVKEAYARFLEKVVQEIKKTDPNHPVVSVDAWTVGLSWWEKYVPSLDAYGINAYGRGLIGLPGTLAKDGVKKPWFITEFGSQGEWDVGKDDNGVPREPDDEEKYNVITAVWSEGLKPQIDAGRCLGLYVFNFSASFDHTNLWLGMLSGERSRPPFHAVEEIYTGKKSDAVLPHVVGIAVRDVQVLSDGTWATVKFIVKDPESKPLDISFAYLNRNAASRHERDAVNIVESKAGPAKNIWLVKMPKIKGSLKLYAIVKDTRNNLVTATTSVKVP